VSVFTISKHIDASPERVFALATDFARAPDVIGGIDKVEMLTDGPVGAGTRFLETRTLFRFASTQEVEITHFEPPRHYALACESHGSRYLTEVRLEPNRTGTQVEMRFEAQPQSFMAKAMVQTMQPMLDSVARELERDLEDMKAVLEAASGLEQPD